MPIPADGRYLSPISAPTRPLPVFVLADISGSMRELRKIETLNDCVTTMIRSFAAEDSTRGEIQVGVVTFGDTALLHQPLVPAAQLSWTDMRAGGGTPLGAAFTLLTNLLADEEVIPRRAFMPVLILVSDGKPTDEWEEPLERLLASPRGSKAVRLAVGIGSDMEEEDFSVLRKFIARPGAEPKRADEVHLLTRYFSWVTMSVTAQARTGRQTAAEIDLDDLDELL
jgi:uncharacterized protein YegL